MLPAHTDPTTFSIHIHIDINISKLFVWKCFSFKFIIVLKCFTHLISALTGDTLAERLLFSADSTFMK